MVVAAAIDSLGESSPCDRLFKEAPARPGLFVSVYTVSISCNWPDIDVFERCIVVNQLGTLGPFEFSS